MSGQLTVQRNLSQMIIENPGTSAKNSFEFLKKVTIVAISSITKVRAMFPTGAYDDRKWEGIKLQLIKKNKHVPGTKELVEAIKHMFELLESQHLVRMFFVVKNEKQEAVETYKMHFTYKEEQMQCEITSENEAQEAGALSQEILPSQIKDDIKKLLHNIEDHASQLKPLPKDFGLSLRIEVLDDEKLKIPEVFYEMDELDLNFPPTASSSNLGHANSKFANLGISYKSDNYKSMEELKEVPYPLDNTLGCGTPPTCKIDTPLKLSDTLSSSVYMEENKIRCICQRSDDVLETIICTVCGMHQHKACYKLQDDQHVDRHVCVSCHDPNNEDLTCTNTDLLTEKGEEEALYRRALSLCQTISKISVSTLVSQLNLPRKEATKILNRLTADGCFHPESVERNLRSVNEEHLRDNVLNLYFNTVNLQDRSRMDTEDNPATKSTPMIEQNRKRKCDLDLNPKEKRIRIAGTSLKSTNPTLRCRK